MTIRNGKVCTVDECEDGFTPYIKASDFFKDSKSFKQREGLHVGDFESVSQMGRWIAGLKTSHNFIREKKPGKETKLY